MLALDYHTFDALYCVLRPHVLKYKILGWHTYIACHLFFWMFKPWCQVFLKNQVININTPSFSLVISMRRKPFEYKPSLKMAPINKVSWALALHVVGFVKMTIKNKWCEQKSPESGSRKPVLVLAASLSRWPDVIRSTVSSEETICIIADTAGFWPSEDSYGCFSPWR